jgi:heptosyltransferase-2
MLINAEMVPLFIGGADSSSYTEEILQGVAPELVLNYTGSTNLEESASLLSAVDALISSDSGVMHVGMSCGTPLVALFGSTPSRDRIEGVPVESLRIIEGYAHCRLAPCYSGYGEVVCPFNHECINHILPEEVYENLISLLDSRARNRCESIPRD